MKNKKTLRALVAVTTIVTLLSLFHVISLTIQSLYISGAMGTEFSPGWNEKILWGQIIIFSGRIVSGYTFYLLLTLFMFNSVRGYKKGIIFPKTNVKLLYGCSISYFFYSFFNLNIDIIGATNEYLLKLDTESVVLTLLFAIFALMYHIAEKISEENNLTI